jgi:chaperonin cofactor prefoldin
MGFDGPFRKFLNGGEKMGKISKKYIGSNQVGASQIELENESAIRAKSFDGLSSINLMELDPSNLLQMLQHPHLPGNASSALQSVPKQQLDSAVLSIDIQISSIETRMIASESDIDTIQSELSQAQSDISSLNDRVSSLESSMSSAQTSILSLESRVSTLESEMIQAQFNISSNTSRLDLLEPRVSTLESEMSTAQTAISNLQSEDLTFLKHDGSRSMTGSLDMGNFNISNLAEPTSPDQAATKSYVDALTFSITMHKQSIILSATDITNQYVDLSVLAIANSCIVGVGERVMLWESLVFSTSTVGGVTRLTFAGPSATGGGEALVEGQTLYIKCIV